MCGSAGNWTNRFRSWYKGVAALKKMGWQKGGLLDVKIRYKVKIQLYRHP